jgi:hypothetical protein
LSDEVLRFSGDVHAARRAAGENDEAEPSEAVSATAELIASSSTAFVVTSSAIPELLAMYFVSGRGVGEATLVSGRAVVAVHPQQISIASLLYRHLQDGSGVALFVRHHRDGGRLHLALSGGVSAYSDDGVTWREGDAARAATEVLQRFITE